MKRRIAILASFLLVFLPLGAGAIQPVTVTPLAGASGQSTVVTAYFANPIGVKVTDAAGAPVAGRQVDFIDHEGVVFFAGADAFSGHTLAFTDANGVAIVDSAVGFMPGDAIIDVTTIGSDAGYAAIPLTVLPGGTVRFVAISGGGQRATVNTSYSEPWVAQALDATGRPVPRASAFFFAEEDPTLPSVLFNGSTSVWVRADDNGFAVSPYFAANGISGHDEGGVLSYRGGGSVQSPFFAFTNMPSGGSGGGSGEGCGRQGKGNGNCGNSPAHSGGKGNNGKGKG